MNRREFLRLAGIGATGLFTPSSKLLPEDWKRNLNRQEERATIGQILHGDETTNTRQDCVNEQYITISNLMKTEGTQAVHLRGKYFLTANHAASEDGGYLLPERELGNKPSNKALPYDVVASFEKPRDLALLRTPEQPKQATPMSLTENTADTGDTISQFETGTKPRTTQGWRELLQKRQWNDVTAYDDTTFTQDELPEQIQRESSLKHTILTTQLHFLDPTPYEFNTEIKLYLPHDTDRNAYMERRGDVITTDMLNKVRPGRVPKQWGLDGKIVSTTPIRGGDSGRPIYEQTGIDTYELRSVAEATIANLGMEPSQLPVEMNNVDDFYPVTIATPLQEVRNLLTDYLNRLQEL